MRYDGAGNLYIANGNGTVSRLGADGDYGVVATGLNLPKDIEIGADGQGGVVARGFSNATEFTLAPDGGFYVVDNSSTVKHVNSAGAVSTVRPACPTTRAVLPQTPTATSMWPITTAVKF